MLQPPPAFVKPAEMRITRIETLHLRPRKFVVKIQTDAGLCGLGEATLECRSLTVEIALREMGRW